MMSAELIVELLAKSSVVAGAGLLLSPALDFRPPVDPVDVVRASLCLPLGRAALASLAPDLQIQLLPAAPVETAVPHAPVWQGAIGPVAGLSLSGAIRPLSPMDFVIGAWVIGAVAVFGRFILGVLTLRRWTRSGRPVTEAAWTEPQGAVLGTARYSSPEQAQGQAVNGKADVYSPGLVLIQCVTGPVPFPADPPVPPLEAPGGNARGFSLGT